MTRRTAIQAFVAAAVAGNSVAQAFPVGRSIGLLGAEVAGGFPNSAPAFLPMRQVYPAPTGVQSYEPHQWAYWDGTNAMQYRKRVGVSFGRWPYTYKLTAGPPGMSIGATSWNTAWDGQGNAAYNAGYGVVIWTPQGNISSAWSGTVSVLVTDQDGNTMTVSWSLSTSSSTSQFFFLNADTGSDSTGIGTFTSPCKTIQHAIGTSRNSTGAAGAAPAASSLVLFGATAIYAFPGYTDSNYGSGTFESNATYKPNAVIGFPGQTATIDLSGGAAAQAVCPVTGDVTGPATGLSLGSAGFLMQDVTLSSYQSAVADFRAFIWGYLNRISFQGVTWANAGYGSASNNNASMFYTTGGGPGYGSYTFITGCVETNRQSNTQANNCALCELYSLQDVLIEFNYANSPSSQVGEAFYMKSDIGYGCLRANVGIFAGCDHAFDWGQAPYQNSVNSESSYNVGVNVLNFNVPEIVGYNWGALAARRNNIVSGGNGFQNQSPNYNMTAPYTGSNTAPYNIGTLTPVISTAATGGSLPAGTWYYVVTTLGITGESSINSSNQNSRMSITSTGSTSVNTVPWLNVPGNNGYRVYRGTSSGGENQYVTVAAGVDSLTDDGTLSWTAGTPPASSTAISANRFNFDSNCMQSPTQTSDPTGGTTASDGHNQYAASGLLNTTTGLLVASNGGKYGAPLS